MKISYKALLSTFLVGAVLFLAVPMASAHAHPKVMVPAADSAGPSPAVVSITYSEAVEPKFSTISVTDADGKKKFNTATAMPVANDPKTMTLALPTLQPGSYVVHWVSVAADGHRLEGQYPFTVK
jgi:methionine-rich copper-binding protein CopC